VPKKKKQPYCAQKKEATMNLKLSTSAVLAINSIVKIGGADSKSVLADKVAASYDKRFDSINGGDQKKRIVQHARNLQALLKKGTGNFDANFAAANAKSGAIGANAIGRKLPDVGILGTHLGRGRSTPKDSNVHPQKRAVSSLTGDMAKKSAAPDVGILQGGTGEQRRTIAITEYGGDGHLLVDYYFCLDIVDTGGEKTIFECSCDHGMQYSCLVAAGVGTPCDILKCCEQQTDADGKEECINIGYGFGFHYEFSNPFLEIGSNYTEVKTQFEVCKAADSSPWCACSIVAPAFCSTLGSIYCDIDTCCQSQTDDAGRVDCVSVTSYDECISSGGNGSGYGCLCEKNAILCTLGEDQEACKIRDCCVLSSNGLEVEVWKDCRGLQNSPTPIVADISDTQVEPTDFNSDFVTPNAANDAETSDPKATEDNSVYDPNHSSETSDPEATGDNSVYDPNHSEATSSLVNQFDISRTSSAESIFLIKTLSLSLITSVVNWFFMVSD
jgi:hypothetical protein